MLLVALTLMVHVEMDAATMIDRATMANVTAEVTEIWKPYADVAFTEEPESGASGHADQIRLVIVDSVPPSRQVGELGLGWIEFHGTQPASTIAVSARSARRLADAATLGGSPLSDLPQRVRDEFVTHALSRGIAHEIGHYLLRSTAHSERGLMRARFSTADLMDSRRARFQLEPAEIVALRTPSGRQAGELGRSTAVSPSSPPQGLSARNIAGSYQDDCLELYASAP